MNQLINIYCDESCHLESASIRPENQFMVLGAISCPLNKKTEVFNELKKIKSNNGLRAFSEMKWTKVTNSKLKAYQEVISYFFANEDLCFRAVIVDKQKLNHQNFNQTHDDFYYKMYWQLLERFIDPPNRYHIYLDMKDTQGYIKVKKLHEVLTNSKHDFNRRIVEKIQEVRSHEAVLIQLTDLMIGAVSYVNRYNDSGKSAAKNNIAQLIKKLSDLSLLQSTSLGARKFNLFCWEGR